MQARAGQSGAAQQSELKLWEQVVFVMFSHLSLLKKKFITLTTTQEAGLQLESC